MLTYNKFIFINYILHNLSVSQVNQSNLTKRAWHAALVWSNTTIASQYYLVGAGALRRKMFAMGVTTSHRTKFTSLQCMIILREASGLRRYIVMKQALYIFNSPTMFAGQVERQLLSGVEGTLKNMY